MRISDWSSTCALPIYDQAHGSYLGRCSEKGCDRGGGAFVNIRRPHMKRNGTDFEGKHREHEDDAKQLTIRNAIFHGQSYIIEARRAGKTVEQGNAKKKNTDGQCSKDEHFKSNFRLAQTLQQTTTHPQDKR